MFRIVDDRIASNTKLCHGIDSCFTVAIPLADAWVVTPVGSNTETDDD